MSPAAALLVNLALIPVVAAVVFLVWAHGDPVELLTDAIRWVVRRLGK